MFQPNSEVMEDTASRTSCWENRKIPWWMRAMCLKVGEELLCLEVCDVLEAPGGKGVGCRCPFVRQMEQG